MFVDYDRRWRSSRSGIVCAKGRNDPLNGAVRGSLRGLTSVRLYGWTSFKFSSDWRNLSLGWDPVSYTHLRAHETSLHLVLDCKCQSGRLEQYNTIRIHQ